MARASVREHTLQLHYRARRIALRDARNVADTAGRRELERRRDMRDIKADLSELELVRRCSPA
jgi:hypothetical protein